MTREEIAARLSEDPRWARLTPVQREQVVNEAYQSQTGEVSSSGVGDMAASAVISRGVDKVGDAIFGSSAAANTGTYLGAEMTIPAGTAIPEGYVGVAEMADGSTAIAPAAESGGLLAEVAPYLGAVQAGLGGYQAYQGFSHGGKGARTGMTNMGAGIGTMILPGVGTVVGAAAGNVLGYLGKRFGLAHKSTKQLQAERRNALLEKGTAGYEGYQRYLAEQPQDGRNGAPDPALAADFVGFGEDGKYSNNKFATSRNEADLTPYDIWGHDAMFETFGDDWLGGGYTEAQRYAVANSLLKNGLIQEKKGMIYITDPEKAKELAAAAKEDKTLQEGYENRGVYRPKPEGETSGGSAAGASSLSFSLPTMPSGVDSRLLKRQALASIAGEQADKLTEGSNAANYMPDYGASARRRLAANVVPREGEDRYAMRYRY